MRMRYRMEGRQERVRSDFKRSSLVARILQGLFITAVGIVIIVVNLSSNTQFQKVSGHITEIDENMANGVYNASNLSIDSSSDIFIFNKENFTPVWSDKVFKQQRVDIYYQDGTPKKVVAIVLYDPSGTSSTKFTTVDYDAAMKGSSGPSLVVIIGAIIVLLGILWTLRGTWLIVASRFSRDNVPPALYAQSSLTGQQPKSYEYPTNAPLTSGTTIPPTPSVDEQKGNDFTFKEY